MQYASMDDVTDVCPWPFLAMISPPHSGSPTSNEGSLLPSQSPQRTSFAQALQNACDIPFCQLPHPCLKGDDISIKVPEDEYKAGLESCNCKNHLHGCLLLSKRDSSIKVNALREKLSKFLGQIELRIFGLLPS